MHAAFAYRKSQCMAHAMIDTQYTDTVLIMASGSSAWHPFSIRTCPTIWSCLWMMWMPSGLLYTDAPEITGLANLPLGLALGPVYQLINVSPLGCLGVEDGPARCLKVPLIEICRMDPKLIQVAFSDRRRTSHENFSLRSSDFENEALITHRLGFDSRLPGSFLECQALIEPDAKSPPKSPHFMFTLVDDWRSRSRAILLSLARLLLEGSVLSMQPGRRM